MYRLTTKCTTKNESKKHVCALVYIDYLLFSRVTYFRRHSSVTLHARAGHVNLVKSRDLLTYTLECVDLWVRSETEWDPIFPFRLLMGLKLSKSAITVNSVIYHAVVVLADRTTACSTIG